MKLYKVLILFISAFFLGSLSTLVYIEHHFMENAEFEVILSDLHEGHFKMTSIDPIKETRYTVGIYPINVTYSQRFMPECKLSITECSKLY